MLPEELVLDESSLLLDLKVKASLFGRVLDEEKKRRENSDLTTGKSVK